VERSFMGILSYSVIAMLVNGYRTILITVIETIMEIIPLEINCR